MADAGIAAYVGVAERTEPRANRPGGGDGLLPRVESRRAGTKPVENVESKPPPRRAEDDAGTRGDCFSAA